MLKEKPMRLSHISNKLEVTTAEVSRHLDRLGKARLIERNSENYYNITPFATIVLSEYSNFDFLTKNIDFFVNHDLTLIPEHLHWFNSMAYGNFTEGTLETSSIIKDASVDAKKFIHVISEEVMRGLVEIDAKKNDEGVVFKKIYPKDVQFPSEYESRLSDTFEIRTLEDIPLAMKMNEKIAGVALRDINGKVDYSAALVGENEYFRRWISAIFEYYWNMAKPLL
ncbi:MAG: ArsR family transcriptional regulator [Methanomassiliicoccales archaeon]|nr:MAG: ArsR family transcriptional regulator [Methanomassiliicoccales archaeon]